VARSIFERHGQIDLLVNNAGVNVPKRNWNELEISGWDQIVEVNLSGVLYAIHAVLPAMRDRKSGSIINIASWAGRIVSQNDRAGLYRHQARNSCSHSFVQYGRVPQRPQGMLPFARRSGDSNYEDAPGAALGRSHVEDAPAGRPRAYDRVRGEPASPCLRQRDPDQSRGESYLLGYLVERGFGFIWISVKNFGGCPMPTYHFQ
jgi:NAD(P)-dependent dehydrogenase (short-subunit alcohol dehydrogenase family)